jgi:hypothetical protein
VDVSRIFTESVSSIDDLHAIMRDVMVSETLVLRKGLTLYPKPVDDTADVGELEIHEISWYKPGTEEPADPEYGMVMDLDLEPVKHFASPALTILYKSRLYYVDAYMLLAESVRALTLKEEDNG